MNVRPKMLPIPENQQDCNPPSDVGAASPKKQQPTSTTPSIIHYHQGDRPSPDQDARGLPVFIRFKNLKAAGIVENWPHLLTLIEQQNFPAGTMLSPNVRAWNIEDVRQWLATRPTDRKVVRRRQVAQAAHQQNSNLEGTSK
jgi:hypothetical protein